jgi:hypothetical protein
MLKSAKTTAEYVYYISRMLNEALISQKVALKRAVGS